MTENVRQGAWAPGSDLQSNPGAVPPTPSSPVISSASRLLLGLALALMLSGNLRADEPPQNAPNPGGCPKLFTRIAGTALAVKKAVVESGRHLLRRISAPRQLPTQEYAALKDRLVEAYFVDSEGHLLTAPDPSKTSDSTPTKKPVHPQSRKKKRPRTNAPVNLGDAVRAQKNHLDGLKLDLEATARFLEDVELYLHNRRSIQGFNRYRRFLDWWRKRSEVYLNKPVIELIIKENMTMGDFVDHLHLQYVASQMAQKNESVAFRFARSVFRNPLAAGAAASVAYGTAKLIGFIWQLMVLGPGVQMVNAYTEPVVQPLSNTARQRGAMDLADAAETLQEFLSGSGELNQFRTELETLTEDLKGLSPEEAKDRWEEFELMYFRIFQRYQQTLPLHLRQGRQLFKEFALFNPMYLASALADFDIQYWTHDRALKDIERDLRSQGREPTEQELREMQIHRQQRTAAESRIASTLASWKMYEFIFPEFSRSPLNSGYRATLKGHYDKFREHLRFEVYQQQFGQQMQMMLDELEFHYELQNKLRDVKQSLDEAASPVPATPPTGNNSAAR